ncbi:charged multivesicular body protein 6 [Xylariaceae sp. FL1019]|nr:charged multivesicular body protein 6 [Xylariaceae sp. FL1019]
MGNNSSRVTAQDKAILDLKNQRDSLHRYQKRILILTSRETEIARALLTAGDKKRALLALRRKKYQESLLEKTDAQLFQLEQLVRNVEFALIQKDIVYGLSQGTKVLQEIHAEMGGIEHVEKLMGESADAVAYQQEISEMLGGRISNADEDEVEDELAAMEAEANMNGAVKDSTKNTTAPIKAPSAPIHEPLPDTPAVEPQPMRRPEKQAMLAS